MARIIILIHFLLFPMILSKGSVSDQEPIENQILDQRIKSVRVHTEGWNLSYPVINLNSNEKLVFMFDLLDNMAESYYYTFLHCDKDWKKSEIFTNDYLEGFPDNPIEDMKASFNTTVNYFHYSLVFPDEKARIKISGNYILMVYPADNPDKPVILQRFIVKENAVKITLRARRPSISKAEDSGQQIEFTVDISGAGIIDPFRNIYASVIQNGRWDNAKNNLKPDVYGSYELIYNSLSDKNIFTGGNEFRYFDIRSIKHLSEFVRRIDFMPPYYHVSLTPSESREFKPYFYWQDFNGKYYIAIQEGKDYETDADYLNVYFTLSSPEPLPGGDVYVSGSLANWSFGNENLMIYNSGKRVYECTMQLKQGWYNYEYVFVQNGMKNGNSALLEGSHTETENDYMAIIYYKNPRDRYDRVIGTGTINTLNRITY
jgi:hypothetical protein